MSVDGRTLNGGALDYDEEQEEDRQSVVTVRSDDPLKLAGKSNKPAEGDLEKHPLSTDASSSHSRAHIPSAVPPPGSLAAKSQRVELSGPRLRLCQRST